MKYVEIAKTLDRDGAVSAPQQQLGTGPTLDKQCASVIAHPTLQLRQRMTQPLSKKTGQISGDMWRGAVKRHCESRAHLRSLLSRYIQPHSID